jgi:hypothetical protein
MQNPAERTQVRTDNEAADNSVGADLGKSNAQ